MANDEQSYHLEQPTLRQALIILINFKIWNLVMARDLPSVNRKQQAFS